MEGEKGKEEMICVQGIQEGEKKGRTMDRMTEWIIANQIGLGSRAKKKF
jgi:hypothetical protein